MLFIHSHKIRYQCLLPIACDSLWKRRRPLVPHPVFPLPRSLPVGQWLDQSVNKYRTPGTAGLCLQSGDWGRVHCKYCLNNLSRFIPLGWASSGRRGRVCLACRSTGKGEKRGSSQELLTKTIWLLGVWQYYSNVTCSSCCVRIHAHCVRAVLEANVSQLKQQALLQEELTITSLHSLADYWINH